jgi:hypothetical protein
MIQSRDELIMEMAKEYGLNCMGENDDEEDEDDEYIWLHSYWGGDVDLTRGGGIYSLDNRRINGTPEAP